MCAWVLSSFLVGCGMETTPIGAGSAGTSGSTEPAWPKRVTLVTQLGATQSNGVQLEEGDIIAGEGDLKLDQAMVLSIATPTPESLCEKGTFAALGDIPTAVDACPAAPTGTWEKRVYLSAASLHTSEESTVIGLGLLVRNEDHTALYRLRVVGDSYDAEGMSTATFDYEPVP